MVSESLARNILREMDHMPIELQRRVLDFAHALAGSQPKGTAGEDLLRFRGALSRKDADAMSAAIERGCERIDPDAW